MKWFYTLVAVVGALLLVRESLHLTRGRRARRAASSGQPVEPPTLRTRLVQRLYWPIFLALMTLVVLLGLLAGVAVAPNR